ncbi:MAG: o-succinylbenzoate synthase [Halanaeroarchaeum sp.]
MKASLLPFTLPLVSPLETAAGTVAERSGWIFRIEDDCVGFGEATPLPGFTETHEETETALRRALEAVEDDDWPAAFTAVAGRPAARNAVATAALDVRARRADRPLAGELGGSTPTDPIPVNATIGDAPVSETASAAASAVTEGFGTVKVKVGARPLPEDRDRIRAVRDRLPGDVDLRLDANGAWDRRTAATAIDEFRSLDVEYLEQPLQATDLEGHRNLRGSVPIALDESLGRRSWRAVLDAKAADVLVLKPMALGGPEVTRAVARFAERRGHAAVVSNTIDGVVARTAAAHVAGSLGEPAAAGLATGSMLERDLAPDAAPVESGAVRLADAPGLGIDEVIVDA